MGSIDNFQFIIDNLGFDNEDLVLYDYRKKRNPWNMDSDQIANIKRSKRLAPIINTAKVKSNKIKPKKNIVERD